MFLHTFHPSPVIFHLGFAEIHWYGLLISLGIIIASLLGRKLFRRYQLPDHLFLDLVFYLVLGGLIGARFWHVFSEYSYYYLHPLAIFKIWQGGLAIHGALLAGVLVIYFFVQKNFPADNEAMKQWNKATINQTLNQPPIQNITTRSNFFLLLLDIFAPLIALGQGLGRWGNYFNQELYGQPTNLPWAIPIDLLHRLPGYENFQYFHPLFLYESLWCLLIFAFLIYLHRLRFKEFTSFRLPSDEGRVGRGAEFFNYYPVTTPGSIFFAYLILYSFGRFLIGFLRIDPQFNFWGLRLDQWVSIVLFFIGLIYLIYNSYLLKKENND